jgi:hypothetical protein
MLCIYALFSTNLNAIPDETEPATGAFPLSSVRLCDRPFKKTKMKNMNGILALYPDRLAPHLKEAGLDPSAELFQPGKCRYPE